MWIHAKVTKCWETFWTDTDLGSDTPRKMETGNTCLFHYLVLICVFLVLAKAKSTPTATKPVNEDSVLPLPSQRKLKRNHCSL